ncbi:MAG: HisA/HisF-related TIM barrel protein, partial [Saprospiraceae bacterium]
MFRPRVIPVLLLHNGGLYKTVRFSDPTYLGDPINAVKIFNDAKADELIFLDIDRKEAPDYDIISKISEETMMPFSYGGSIHTLDTAVRVFDHGAEKIVINSACYDNYDLITQITAIYGGQALVVSIDVRLNESGTHILYSESGKKVQSISLEDHITKCEAAGAGEFFINSIDRDGTFD